MRQKSDLEKEAEKIEKFSKEREKEAEKFLPGFIEIEDKPKNYKFDDDYGGGSDCTCRDVKIVLAVDEEEAWDVLGEHSFIRPHDYDLVQINMVLTKNEKIHWRRYYQTYQCKICKEYEIGIVSLIDHKHQEAKA